MMAPRQPLISVVMPVYMGERYLDTALQSIDEQHDPDVEVVVVDDGSTDRTREIVERWRDRLTIHAHWLKHQGNWVVGTNHGMSVAGGEWICILHQDDAWQPGRLAALREAINRNPQAGMILHPADFVDDENRKIGCWRCPLPADVMIHAGEMLPRLIVQNFIPVCSPLFRRDVMSKAGPMDEALWYFGDWDYWLRLSALKPVVYLNHPLAVFRIHAGSQTAWRTGEIDDVCRQFSMVTDRAWRSASFPAAWRGSTLRMNRFSRAMYALMLGIFHGGARPWGEVIRSGFAIGPSGWWHYIRCARLADRVLPRLKTKRLRRPV
jgi:GT2 family glycosyltransferase